MEATCGYRGGFATGSGPAVIKLMQLLGLKFLQPKDVAIENLAEDTLTVADEVARRRESFERLGFPFADALKLERKPEYHGHSRGVIDD